MKKQNLIAVAIMLSSIFGAIAALADTYRAGNFTVTLGDSENGKTYQGCDAKGNCIKLNDGTSWRDRGYRGITWENGEYGYTIFWKEASRSPMYLKIFKNHKLLLQRQLVFVK